MGKKKKKQDNINDLWNMAMNLQPIPPVIPVAKLPNTRAIQWGSMTLSANVVSFGPVNPLDKYDNSRNKTIINSPPVTDLSLYDNDPRNDVF